MLPPKKPGMCSEPAELTATARAHGLDQTIRRTRFWIKLLHPLFIPFTSPTIQHASLGTTKMYETTTAPKPAVSVRAQGRAFEHPQDALIYLYGANEALWRWAGIVHGAAAENGCDIGNMFGGWMGHPPRSVLRVGLLPRHFVGSHATTWVVDVIRCRHLRLGPKCMRFYHLLQGPSSSSIAIRDLHPLAVSCVGIQILQTWLYHLVVLDWLAVRVSLSLSLQRTL